MLDNLLYCHLNLLTAALSFIRAHKLLDKESFCLAADRLISTAAVVSLGSEKT